MFDTGPSFSFARTARFLPAKPSHPTAEDESQMELDFGMVVWVMVFVVVAEVSYVVARVPWAFALGIAAILVLMQVAPTEDRSSSTLVARDRSFFGVNTVTLKRDGRFAALVHGTTIHGAQHVEPGRRREPLTYFHRDGPVGSFFRHLPEAGGRSVGVIGLGIGTTACYRRPGDDRFRQTRRDGDSRGHR